jgi:putative transposase
MARPLRLEFAGALYHVTARGDRREDIFIDEADRERFLAVLAEVESDFNWALHAYCLMDNHYHLLIETPDGNLSKGMRQLNGVYTQRFNRRHGRVGHVFQGRFKAILVQKESYLLELARYIVLNPVRARMVRDASRWRWSSYRATAGLIEKPQWLHIDGVLSAFSSRRVTAIARYAAFVAEGKNQPSPWEQLRNQVFLGSEEFVAKRLAQVVPDESLSEVPALQRRPIPPALMQLASNYPRDDAIGRAYASGGYSLKEIGDHFGVHYSRVSQIVREWRNSKIKT